jgi:hypothetical protein
VFGRTLTKNLTLIYLAFRGYANDHDDSLLPAYTTGQNGKPLHSWRTTLLPYFGDKRLYDQIEFDAPWNSERNRRLAAHEPIFYRCPDDTNPDSKLTGYGVVCSPNGLWPGSTSGKLAANSDNSDLVLLVEIEHSDIEWMEPRDLTLKEALDATQSENSANAGRLSIVAYMTVGGEIRRLDNDEERKLFRERLQLARTSPEK